MRKSVENLRDRAIGSGKVSSIVGAVLGAAVAGASQYYTSNGGNVGTWQPYAISAGIAVGGLLFKR